MVEVIGINSVGVHTDAYEGLARVGVEGGGGGVSGMDEGFGGDGEIFERMVELLELGMGAFRI